MDYAITAIIGIASTAAIYSYLKMVPSDYGFSSNLEYHPSKTLVYKPDFWPEHGYADLPNGKTHYYLIGPEDGKKVVFVHGILPTPPACYNFLNSLAEKGYRILCYELYGRGYSDAPGTVYDDGLFVSQLTALLLYLQWGKTDIIGYSMGGAITCGYVSRFPHTINKVILMAPAGLVKGLPVKGKILGIPVIGKFLTHTIGRHMVAKGSANNHYIKNEMTDHFNQIQRFQLMHHPGIMRAFRSTVCNFKFGDYHDRYRLLEESHKDKVCAIWGEFDAVVPTSLSAELKELMPSLELHIRENTSHSIPMEDPEFVVQTMDAFLKK
jgi:pimeloyl-ACP methyl ester carboxylesterase